MNAREDFWRQYVSPRLWRYVWWSRLYCFVIGFVVGAVLFS